MSESPIVYTVSDAAAALGLAVSTIVNQIHNKRITPYRRRPYMFTAQEVERYRVESKGKVGRKGGK